MERLAKTNQAFRGQSPAKEALKKRAGTRLKTRPTFNLSIGNLYYVTEKEENVNWNEISNKALEEKVKQSIQDVDKVLKIRGPTEFTKSISTADNYGHDLVIQEESPTVNSSSKTRFEKFRTMLKISINAESKKKSFPSLKTSKNSPVVCGDTYKVPNLRYNNEEYHNLTGSLEKKLTYETTDEKQSLQKKDSSDSSPRCNKNGDSIVEYDLNNDSDKKVLSFSKFNNISLSLDLHRGKGLSQIPAIS